MVGLPPKAMRNLWLRYESKGSPLRISFRILSKAHAMDLRLHTDEEMAGDGFEAPEKVTATDLFYLTSMDKGTAVSIPYLLAQYLFRHDKRRKRGARFFGEYFVGRLVDHFGLVTEEGFQELTVVVGELR
ncbi:hypothetical protein Tco_1578739 [Tanacetum coccineum]